jgi:hypothetical protein
MKRTFKQFIVIFALAMIPALSWGQFLPGANHNSPKDQSGIIAVEKSPNGIQTVWSSSKALFDLLFSYPVSSPRATGIETDGVNFYCTRYDASTIYKLSMTGALVDSFSIAGVSAIRDLAYDGQYFYGGAATASIYKMDFTTHTLVSTITCPAGTAVRHIAYDNINDAFWVGNWDDDFKLISRTGTTLATIPATGHGLTGAYGSAFDPYSDGGPYLWIYDQGGNGNDLVQINIATGLPTGVTFDVTTVVSTSGGIAGGCFISENIIPDTAVIGGVIQNETIWGLELKSIAIYANDIAVEELVNPTSDVQLTSTDQITVVVKNADTVSHNNIPLAYTIDGGSVVRDTLHAALAGGASTNFTFTQVADLSIPGHQYTIKVYSEMAGDGFNNNDTIVENVRNLWDVAPVAINMAPVIIAGIQNPVATVKNMGSMTTGCDVTMTITGGYSSTKTVSSLAPGASTQVTFDPWIAAVGAVMVDVNTILAADSVPSNNHIQSIVEAMSPIKAFCYVAACDSTNPPKGPAKFVLQTPGTITSIANQSTSNYVSGGTWGYGNRWIGAVYGDKLLIEIDTTTGARTVIGPTTEAFTSISFDPTTNTLYGISWDGTNSKLYTINSINAASTLVGICDTTILVGLACDGLGDLYTASIGTDKLYSVDKGTGAITVIGPLGFDANYDQDLEFDPVNGRLFMSSYNAATSGEMRIVNTSTGMTTLIAPLMNGAEITGMAIPYDMTLPANDLALVSINGLQSACNMTATNPVEITVKNFGTTAVSSFTATMIVDGGTPVPETVTATIATGTSYDYTFIAPADLSAAGPHSIKVFVTLASDSELWNDTLVLNVTNYTASATPYTMGFESSEDISSWKIFDVNADGYTWGLATSGGHNAPACAEYSYNTNSAANDWIISTCILLETGKTYTISYYYKVQSGTYPESMMVHMGTENTPTGLPTMITSYSSITSTTYVAGNNNFTVPADGIYYFGFHCYSAADMWNLYLDDITIDESNSIAENDKDGSFSIWPNPVTSVLNISSTDEISNIRITNMVGSLVYNENVKGNQFRINTADYTRGMYFVSLSTAQGTTTRKFIVD